MLQKGFVDDMDNKYDWPGEMFLKAKNDKILFHEYEEWIAHHIIMKLKNIDASVESTGIRRESTVKHKMGDQILGKSAKSPHETDLSKSITPKNTTFSLSANNFTET